MKFSLSALLLIAELVVNPAFASDDCSIEKPVAVAWIQGHLSMENGVFKNEFTFDSCVDEGYTEIVAVMYKSATTICAIDVDPKSYAVVVGNRGCYPLK